MHPSSGERHTPENAHSPRCFGRRAAVATRAEDDQVFHPQPPIPPPHRAAGGIHILVYDRISYHIYTKKKQTASSKPFAAPSRKTPQGQQTKRRCGAAAPRHCTPRGATQNASAGGQNPRNSYTYTTLRGTEGKNLAARQGFFGKSSLKNAHFCYNSSKVPLCGGPAGRP